MARFADMKLNPALSHRLKEQGIENATAVQMRTIPLARKGCDLIVQSQTGTGKTLAFLLPLLERIKKGASVAQALVIAPTRELAQQVAKVAALSGEAVGISSLVIYGGEDIERQKQKLKRRPQLIIGTPGRLLDHVRRHTLDLKTVNKVVIDEADEMLKMGFIEDVELLIGQTAPDRQLMLFSATMPERVRYLAKRYMNEPQEILLQPGKLTLDTIEQMVVDTTEETKLDKLCELINAQQPYLAMVFCHTKERAQKLTTDLAKRGYLVDALHGDLSQTQRKLTLKKFREAKLQILVATDIAARGLDIEGVTHVYNYDLPQNSDWYINRIGRTGRAGEKGVAVTFVNARQYPLLRRIEAEINENIARRPTRRSVEARKEKPPQDKPSSGSQRKKTFPLSPAVRERRGPRKSGHRVRGQR